MRNRCSVEPIRVEAAACCSRKLAVSMNFNHKLLISHVLSRVSEELNSKASSQEKIETISWHQKELKQLQETPNVALHPTLPSVKDRLAVHLQSELDYLQNKLQSGITIAEEPTAEVEEESETYGLKAENINFNLTVEELGLLTKIMYNCKMITNRQILPMMRGLAKMVHTKHQAKVSPNSLYNCFHTIKEQTTDSLYDKLLEMVNSMQKIRAKL